MDRAFCDFLEYEICRAFENSGSEEIKGFWCDGVLLSEPEVYYSAKFINDNRQTVLKAFIGNDGQTEYTLILKFGNDALSRYARNLDMKECTSFANKKAGWSIDIKDKKIEIQLD